MKWEDVPLIAKFLGSVIVGVTVAIAASILWMFSTFVTQAQDQQQWQYHQQAVTCNRVSELRLEIERVRWEVENLQLTAQEIQNRNNLIASLEREITRLDPRGIC